MTSPNSQPGIRSMTERYSRPDWVRRLNAMADSVGGDARRIVSMDGRELLATAEASLGGTLPTGTFGDAGWRDRFVKLATALDSSPMHTVGRLMTRQELLRAVRTRLLLNQELERHPEIENERILAPMIVTGPARSGTTILFELLALDPELRAPLACEGLHPLPRRTPGECAERQGWSECEQELWADVQPEFAAMHELRSDLPVECVTLTIPSFAGPHWLMIAQLAGDWLPDTIVNYDFHRRLLKVLQFGATPRTWLLKTPGHLMTLEDLFATYPDAWIVQTHRDPAKTMPSTVSTTAMVQWMRTDHVEAGPLTQAIQMAFSYGLNHTVELRTASPYKDRFVDVHFDAMLRDPVRTLGQAYEKMGRQLSPDHAERVRAYLRDKPKGKFGTHQYSPEDWGFTTAGLRNDLKPYIDYFQVKLED